MSAAVGPSTAQEASRPKLPTRVIDSEDLGFKIFHELPKHDEIEIDIVAVHGLAADPDWTWTLTPRLPDGTKLKDVNWLKDDDMLHAALPKARIMRFGYDSIWYGSGAAKQRLANIANELLTDLKYERRDCEDRPIIFVGHCFGGLIMQKAYNLAKANDVDYPGIWRATTGMVFIGTPHQGAGSALHSQGQIYQAIAAHELPTEEGILHNLEHENETLVDIVREFTRLVNLRPPPVNLFCFFEQKSTIVGKIVKDDNIKEFVVGESSGVLHGHPYSGLPLDHFTLNKYKSPKDRNYIRVRNEIVTMAEKSKALLETRTPSQKPAAPSMSGHGPAQMMPRQHGAGLRLPYARDPIFAPRNNILQRIEEKFGKNVKVALCGMAGSGKTHIAVEYAHKYSKDFPVAKVLWVNARTVEQFERSYRVILEDLRIANKGGNVLKSVQRHLNQDANGNWLMVLDGVDDEASLAILSASGDKIKDAEGKSSLLDYVPQSMSGRVLFTSRVMSLASSLLHQKSEYLIEIPALTDDDTALLLYGNIPNDTAKKQIAVELGRALAKSPLAINMAAAYIRAQGDGFLIRNYLEFLGPGTPKPGVESTLSEKDEVQQAVDKAWKIAYKFLKDKDAEAARLMLVLASLNLQTVRTFFLAKGTDAGARFAEHVTLLVNLGLIRQSEDRTEVSVTPLIQLCAQRQVSQSDDPVWAGERALALVTAAFPAAESEEFETCEILYPIVSAVLKMQPKTGAGINDRGTLLFKLGGYHKHLGRLEAALKFLNDCLKVREDQPNKDKDLIEKVNKALDSVKEEQRRAESAPEVAMSPTSPGGGQPSAWNNLMGKVQGVMRIAPGAMSPEQHQQMGEKMKAELAECEKELGKDHEDTLRKAEGLAVALHGRDPRGESIAIRKRVLEWCTARYGPRSLDTIRQTYNLALAYDVQGQYDEAAELYQTAFKNAENLLAPGSPELLRILSSMAVVYVAQGKMAQAEEALRVALAGQQAKLGPDHPETLLTRQNAALAAQAQGKFEIVEQDLVHVLQAQERFLGPDNEATLRTACSLALNFRLRKRFTESEELYKLVLDSQRKMLGDAHLDTLMTRLMLGELLQEEGKLPQAKEEYKVVLDGRKLLCGEKHPDTLYVKKRLAAVA
ncbi:hypothetical protein Dda_6650 [Drechslerella dactyloides]|uniref:NB-ARC domain-containing protein n=1 Tax=Drechslerella dactyloides TaxID=74499 RepID=A0AAD6ITW0_DREDA|nr:hypothetical protein Dda_6650 [Drechslerella dactyloides]